MDSAHKIDQYDHVMLYDGVCIFCNNAVDFVLDNEKNDSLRFLPLQSEAGKYILDHFGYPTDYVESVLYLKDQYLYDKSSAALQIAKHLKFPYSLLRAVGLMPKFLRNYLYNIVASRRYIWFGKYDACRVPDPHVRVRFLQ